MGSLKAVRVLLTKNEFQFQIKWMNHVCRPVSPVSNSNEGLNQIFRLSRNVIIKCLMYKLAEIVCLPQFDVFLFLFSSPKIVKQIDFLCVCMMYSSQSVFVLCFFFLFNATVPYRTCHCGLCFIIEMYTIDEIVDRCGSLPRGHTIEFN